MRPRLILSLEQQIQTNINDPTYLYEALKVYLMLGGKAPVVDKALILDWFTHEWEERVFPGAPYAQGRALLAAHLKAMLDMDTGAPPKVSLNGPLVDAGAGDAGAPAGRAARLCAAEERRRATRCSRIGSPRSAADPTWRWCSRPPTARASTRCGCPASSPTTGSTRALHRSYADDRRRARQGQLGARAVGRADRRCSSSTSRLFPDILDTLQPRFHRRLERRDLQSGAAAAARRPAQISGAERGLGADLADQADLRIDPQRDRAHPRARGAAGRPQGRRRKSRRPNSSSARRAAALDRRARGGRSRDEVAAARRRSSVADHAGASIEAYFKPIQILVDGEAGSRPIDALLANLNELYRQLTLAASNPAQSKRALEQVEVEVASLRSNVTRLPQPLAGMMNKVARDAAGDASNRTIAQLTDQMAQEVTAPCQQIVNNRYPFARSDRDVPLADFARIFAPERRHRPLLRRQSRRRSPIPGRRRWTWRSDSNITRPLSVDHAAALPAGRRNPRRLLPDRRRRSRT